MRSFGGQNLRHNEAAGLLPRWMGQVGPLDKSVTFHARLLLVIQLLYTLMIDHSIPHLLFRAVQLVRSNPSLNHLRPLLQTGMSSPQPTHRFKLHCPPAHGACTERF